MAASAIAPVKNNGRAAGRIDRELDHAESDIGDYEGLLEQVGSQDWQRGGWADYEALTATCYSSCGLNGRTKTCVSTKPSPTSAGGGFFAFWMFDPDQQKPVAPAQTSIVQASLSLLNAMLVAHQGPVVVVLTAGLCAVHDPRSFYRDRNPRPARRMTR